MKLHLAPTSGLNVFTSYGEEFVAINGERYTTSVVVLRTTLVAPWEPAAFEQIRAHHLAAIPPLGCEIVLVGTGTTQRFLSLDVIRPLIEAGVGLEVMSTQAACRTYNILAAEDRKVAAAIVLR